MAGRGFPPSGNRQRERDNKPTTKVARAAKLHGKPLPKASLTLPRGLPDADGVMPPEPEWHPQTVAWWDAMRRNPLCADIGPEGWQFLLDTALLHNTAWTEGNLKLFPEIRLRVAKFGVTPEDRARLGVTVTPEPLPNTGGNRLPEGVRDISTAASRRETLLAEG